MALRINLADVINQMGWWSVAVYRENAAGSLIFQGYTQPKWQNFTEHVSDVMGITPKPAYSISFRWVQDRWVRAS